MNGRKAISLIAFLLLTALTANAQEETDLALERIFRELGIEATRMTQDELDRAGSVYRNGEYGFSIVFPAGWKIKGGAAKETVVKAVHRDRAGWLAMITIAAIRLGEPFDLHQVDATTLFEMGEAGSPGIELVLLDDGEDYINGTYAKWLKTEIREPKIASTIGRRYYIVHGKTLFLIDAVTTRDPGYYERYAQILEGSVRTFRFSSPPAGPGSPSIVVTPKNESWPRSFFTAYMEVFLLLLLVSGLIPLVRYLVGVMRQSTGKQG